MTLLLIEHKAIHHPGRSGMVVDLKTISNEAVVFREGTASMHEGLKVFYMSCSKRCVKLCGED